MSAVYFVWCKTKQEELAPQLVTIATNLQTQGAAFGLSPADAANWLQGARVNGWLQTQLIPALRDYSVAATAARDELQLDKSVVDFPFPDFSLPPKPAPVAGAAPLQTDFLDWANKSYQAMRVAGLITLDTGVVMEKTLANSQFTFMVPTDRVHSFDAVSIYADKNGDDLGQWSDVKSDTSEL